jgi:uncharacterized protein
MSSRAWVCVLLAGMLFGAGLAVSTMLQPEVVLAFLRGADMGLLLVLGGAVSVTLVTYQLVPRLRAKAMNGGAFQVHPAVLDRRTVLGASLFGIGWGVCGVCPGPAVAALGAGNWPIAVALIAMFLGAYVQGRWFGEVSKSA